MPELKATDLNFIVSFCVDYARDQENEYTNSDEIKYYLLSKILQRYEV